MFANPVSIMFANPVKNRKSKSFKCNINSPVPKLDSKEYTNKDDLVYNNNESNNNNNEIINNNMNSVSIIFLNPVLTYQINPSKI